MILRKLKSTKPVCPPLDRIDRDVTIASENGVPTKNQIAIDIYNGSQAYNGVYLLISD